MIMKIIIPAMDYPVLWKIDTTTAQASCLYILEGRRIDRAKTNIILRKYSFITVSGLDDTARITDLSSIHYKPLVPEVHFASRPRSNSSPSSSPRSPSETSPSSPGRALQSASTPELVRTNSMVAFFGLSPRGGSSEYSGTRCISPRACSITLDNLGLPDDVRADTLQYQDYFLKKSRDDQKERSYPWLQTPRTLSVAAQYRFNELVNPVKHEMITLLRLLLDEQLSPSYQHDGVPKAVKAFFIELLLRVMKPKPGEKTLPKPERIKRQYPREQQDFVQEQLDLMHVKLSLPHLFFFVSDAISPDTITNDPLASKILSVLRDKVRSKRPEILVIANRLSELTATLIDYLDNQSQFLKEQSQVHPGYQSFYHVMEELIKNVSHLHDMEKKSGSGQSKCRKNVPELIKALIAQSIIGIRELYYRLYQEQRIRFLGRQLMQEISEDLAYEYQQELDKLNHQAQTVLHKIAVPIQGETDFFIADTLAAYLKGKLLTTLIEHARNTPGFCLSDPSCNPALITAVNNQLTPNIEAWLLEHNQLHELSPVTACQSRSEGSLACSSSSSSFQAMSP